MKYNTYAELAEAFKSGELSNNYTLMVDNDYCWLRYYNQSLPDYENDHLTDKARELFRGNGEKDFLEAIRSLDINAEPV